MKYLWLVSIVGMIVLLSGCMPDAALPEDSPDVVAENIPGMASLPSGWKLQQRWTLRWMNDRWFDLSVSGDYIRLWVCCITTDGEPFFVPVRALDRVQPFGGNFVDGPNPPLMYHYVWSGETSEPQWRRNFYVFVGPLGDQGKVGR